MKELLPFIFIQITLTLLITVGFFKLIRYFQLSQLFDTTFDRWFSRIVAFICSWCFVFIFLSKIGYSPNVRELLKLFNSARLNRELIFKVQILDERQQRIQGSEVKIYDNNEIQEVKISNINGYAYFKKKEVPITDIFAKKGCMTGKIQLIDVDKNFEISDTLLYELTIKGKGTSITFINNSGFFLDIYIREGNESSSLLSKIGNIDNTNTPVSFSQDEGSHSYQIKQVSNCKNGGNAFQQLGNTIMGNDCKEKTISVQLDKCDNRVITISNSDLDIKQE